MRAQQYNALSLMTQMSFINIYIYICVCVSVYEHILFDLSSVVAYMLLIWTIFFVYFYVDIYLMIGKYCVDECVI